MIISKFSNEIGNDIKIKIKQKKDVGVNSKTKEKIKFNGVSISIIGPASETENTITLNEAEQMYNCLKKFLGH